VSEVKQRRWDLFGGLAGLALVAADTALLLLSGVEMAVAGRDATLAVAATFGSSVAILGFLVGRLAMARARARADADTIRRQHAELEQSQREALQNEKLAALGRLAAGIAHEVRNPLGVIRASASMIQESFDRDDDASRACQFIKEEIDRLNGLITSMLAFARPGEPQVQPVGVEKLVDRALALADEEIRARAIAVERALEPALVEVSACPHLLSQLLLGLLLNAAEAAGERGRVAIRAFPDGADAVLEVADDGSGIPAEDAARVFEPFFTTKPTGTGLGLAVAQRIAAAHGGTLEVVQGRGAGAAGAGACLRARLPLGGPGSAQA
jgi:two-component system sensor histidine kinase HydH